MPEDRIRVAPNTVAYADRENHKLVVEFAIPGAPTETIDVKILEDSVHLTAPARDIEYVSALALGWPVKPDKAEAIYEHAKTDRPERRLKVHFHRSFFSQRLEDAFRLRRILEAQSQREALWFLIAIRRSVGALQSLVAHR